MKKQLGLLILLSQLMMACPGNKDAGAPPPGPQPSSLEAAIAAVPFERFPLIISNYEWSAYLSLTSMSAVYVSKDQTMIVLPSSVKRGGGSRPVECHYNIVSQFDLSPTADEKGFRKLALRIETAHIHVDDSSSYRAQSPNMARPEDCNQGIAPREVFQNLLRGPYQEPIVELRASFDVRFNDRSLAFKNESGLVAWNQNVFVRYGEEMDITDEFLNWYSGTYYSTKSVGSISIDGPGRSISFRIPPPLEARKSFWSVGAFCPLMFSAPIQKVTFVARNPRLDLASGLYIWMSEKSMGPVGSACALARFETYSKGRDKKNGLIALAVDITDDQGLRLSLQDQYWKGQRK